MSDRFGQAHHNWGKARSAGYHGGYAGTPGENLKHPIHTICVGLAHALFCAALCTAQSKPANILVLLADDLGVDNVAVYGEGTNPPPTPNIDALAARGVLFRNAWANPYCSPTRACLHTGRYAFRTFVGAVPTNNGGLLHPEELTLPEALDRTGTGYAHALIGKWHLGKAHGGDLAPNRAGWSHYSGNLDGTIRYYWWRHTVNGVSGPSSVYATTQTVDDALAWIGTQTKPWLCFVSFNAPHSPFHKPPEGLHTQRLLGKKPATSPRAFFRAMVQAMDTEIGRLLRSLGAELANTDVVFMGDNGTSGSVTVPPFRTDHGKGTPYEGGVNVPLIVAGPSVQDPGREHGALVAAVDIFPTIAELAGADVDRLAPPWVALDGVSLAPYLHDANQAPLRRTVMAEYFRGPTWAASQGNGFAAIRDARFKLIRWYNVGDARDEELYDLLTDPFESRDLLARALQPDAQASYLALRDELDELRRPRARLLTFGARTCVGSAGAPRIRATGSTEVGQHYSVQLEHGPAAQPAILVTGRSTSTWGSLPLPLDLSALGAGSGCKLFNSGEIATLVATDAAGSARVGIQVPEAPALVGRTLFHSWLLTDPAAPENRIGLTSSDAAAAVLGW